MFEDRIKSKPFYPYDKGILIVVLGNVDICKVNRRTRGTRVDTCRVNGELPTSLPTYLPPYRSKKVLWFRWNFAHLKMKIDKFSQFSSFLILLKKCGKKSDSSLKIGNFFTGKSFIKIFPILKLEIEFHSHKKVVSPKLENSAHLFIVYFKCTKFQKNQRTFLDR